MYIKDDPEVGIRFCTAEAVIPCPPAAVFDFLMDDDEDAKHDFRRDTLTIISHVDARHRLSHYKVRMQNASRRVCRTRLQVW